MRPATSQLWERTPHCSHLHRIRQEKMQAAAGRGCVSPDVGRDPGAAIGYHHADIEPLADPCPVDRVASSSTDSKE
jgi:hypothetical protein